MCEETEVQDDMIDVNNEQRTPLMLMSSSSNTNATLVEKHLLVPADLNCLSLDQLVEIFLDVY